MKIGSGWTKNTDGGDTYISVALDEVIEQLCPQLKGCFINLWHIKQEDRKGENSPAWSVNLSVKKDKEQQPQEDEISFL